MPAFFSIFETVLNCSFSYHQQLLWFFFYFLNHSKTLSFHRCLQFWEEEKSQSVWWAGAFSYCKIYYWFFQNSTRFWRTPRHCNQRKQWVKPSHLTEFGVLFPVLALLDASIGMMGFHFNVIATYPWFVTSCDIFEQSSLPHALCLKYP